MSGMYILLRLFLGQLYLQSLTQGDSPGKRVSLHLRFPPLRNLIYEKNHTLNRGFEIKWEDHSFTLFFSSLNTTMFVIPL